MLIINNLQLPVSDNMNVYQSAISSAKVALSSMEDLFNGAAQRGQSGAFLLGLSAWHIYPDMIVRGHTTKETQQKDSLVPLGGIITLGLQSDAQTDKRVFWSLPLAHLRYYGDPIQSSRSTGHDASRGTADQLVYVALGALFKAWFETSRDISIGLQWLCDLDHFFDRLALKTRDANVDETAQESHKVLLQRPGWLKTISCAAAAMRRFGESEKERTLKLVALGFRSYSTMLNEYDSPCSLYFGLFRPQSLFSLIK